MTSFRLVLLCIVNHISVSIVVSRHMIFYSCVNLHLTRLLSSTRVGRMVHSDLKTDIRKFQTQTFFISALKTSNDLL